MVIVLTDHN